ncbi:CPBP family intramembrane metalloprotease [Spongiibacter sp. KMU-158]|uniref:CPBP family intramembrane metalloprotease n=1 Tax=Spongiibacter pelagi TaxID=2760804 RepID=A0A927GW98_9GAMM|nr:CPBP family intramembrane glutamic endopeptidase [Spongiibacter pelagi]MBD2859220.1 CPBP family intramembrane metalloprotease [Spongiibacter pelagi]
MLKRALGQLHPRRIFEILDQIDTQEGNYTLDRPAALRRVFAVLACVSVCLLLIHYMKYQSTLLATLSMVSEWQGRPANYWLIQLRQSGFGDLLVYGWWTFWHVVGYVLLPWLLIRNVLKDRMRHYGWGWGETHKHWGGYVLLLSPILLFVVIASFSESFLNHYPFYRLAGRSGFDLISWEVLYLTQFICLEFFFRGFVLQALRPALGANAIWVMCVPYLMIHFPKLWPEAFGAITFGLFLGMLAMLSRSVWGGFFVHAGIAVGMDLASLIQRDVLPKAWWPF